MGVYLVVKIVFDVLTIVHPYMQVELINPYGAIAPAKFTTGNVCDIQIPCHV